MHTPSAAPSAPSNPPSATTPVNASSRRPRYRGIPTRSPSSCVTQGRDGGIEIEFVRQRTLLPPVRGPYSFTDKKQLVWTFVGSRREEAENVLFALVLEEMRTGNLRGVCRLAPGFYPATTKPALLAITIQNRKLRRELEQMRGA